MVSYVTRVVALLAHVTIMVISDVTKLTVTLTFLTRVTSALAQATTLKTRENINFV